MRKTKDGQVIASLTEVKNKTGDIFALADEYGEVILTSYNKPRYKIVKMDLEDIFDPIPNSDTKPNKEVKTKTEPKIVEEVTTKKKESVQETIEEPKVEKKSNDLAERVITISKWERDNKSERAFVQKATKHLIS